MEKRIPDSSGMQLERFAREVDVGEAGLRARDRLLGLVALAGDQNYVASRTALVITARRSSSSPPTSGGSIAAVFSTARRRTVS